MAADINSAMPSQTVKRFRGLQLPDNPHSYSPDSQRLLQVSNDFFTAGAIFQRKDGIWSIITTAHILNWMNGLTINQIKNELLRKGCSYHWLPLLTHSNLQLLLQDSSRASDRTRRPGDHITYPERLPQSNAGISPLALKSVLDNGSNAEDSDQSYCPATNAADKCSVNPLSLTP